MPIRSYNVHVNKQCITWFLNSRRSRARAEAEVFRRTSGRFCIVDPNIALRHYILAFVQCKHTFLSSRCLKAGGLSPSITIMKMRNLKTEADSEPEERTLVIQSLYTITYQIYLL